MLQSMVALIIFSYPMQNVIISRSKNYTINLFRDRNKWKLHTHPYH